jgi:hypothetical protein
MMMFFFFVFFTIVSSLSLLQQNDVWHIDIPTSNANTSSVPNPFDLHQLRVRVASSDGQAVFGFVYQDYSRTYVNGGEHLTPNGDLHIAARLLARRPGVMCANWTVWINDRVSFQSPMPSSTCVQVAPSSRDRGFVRVAPNRQHFVHERDGSTYFPVGENLCWTNSVNRTYDFDRWMAQLAAVGANYLRLWLAPDFSLFALETVASGGVGRYDMIAAWRVDHVVRQSHALAFKALLCLQTFNSFHAVQPYPAWQSNPYNKANGGPLSTPFAFFTDPTAAAYFKRLLTFVSARYGAFTSVLAWEFFNEVDLVDDFNSTIVAAWHGEMARFVRSVDPFAHMRTTSFSFPTGFSDTLSLPEIDYTQTHSYNVADMAAMTAMFNAQKDQFNKPTLLGEFGISNDANVEDQTDPTGISLFNGLWASLVTGSGTAMTWWWDTWVEPFDLYPRFLGVARVAQQLSPVLAQYRWTNGQVRTGYVRIIARTGISQNASNVPAIMAYVQNVNFTWTFQFGGLPLNPIGPVAPLVVPMPSAKSGQYIPTWFDTTTGAQLSIKTPLITAHGGNVQISVPPTLTSSLFLWALHK